MPSKPVSSPESFQAFDLVQSYSLFAGIPIMLRSELSLHLRNSSLLISFLMKNTNSAKPGFQGVLCVTGEVSGYA
ncbi:hypothetical protein L6452_16900 [Arctium lappa]|uniref:Uncharacterized protein n=1 Tax=Arctium lappa TaxID=4217 RepID=A0ACB9C1T0_ARCLA|nr:hypothetical protein L6452_16900 [Arctium lappa]